MRKTLYFTSLLAVLLAGGLGQSRIQPSQIKGGAAGRLLTDNGASASWLANGASSQVLTMAGGVPAWTTWATGLPSPTAAGKLLYDSGSNWVETAAGSDKQTLRFNGGVPTPTSNLLNDGNGITVAMGATNVVGLTVNGVAGQTADYLRAVDGSSNPVFDVLTGGDIRIQCSSGPANLQGGRSVFPTTGQINDRWDATSIIGGTAYNGASLWAVAAENWSAGHLGTNLAINLCPVGSATLSQVASFNNDGSTNLNALNATTGTFSGGIFATAVTGSGVGTFSGIVNGGGQSVEVTAVGSGGTVNLGAGDNFVRCTPTSAGCTVNLPSASGSGRRYVIKKDSAATNPVTVNRAGSDLIDGATSYTIASGDSYGCVVLVDCASGRWTVESAR